MQSGNSIAPLAAQCLDALDGGLGELRAYDLPIPSSRIPGSILPASQISSSHIPDSNVRELVNLALGQSRIIELIAHGAPLGATLDELLRFVEREIPEACCSVLILDRDGVHLRQGVASRLPRPYTAAIEGLRVGPCAASCGTAVYRREQVLVSDITTDPLWVDYRHLADVDGPRVCWSAPIMSPEGRVLGTFAMYFRDSAAMGVLFERVSAIALHVSAIAVGKELRERAVYESEERYRLLNLATNDAVWDWDVSNGTLWWNDGVTLLFGYPKAEVENSLEWWVDRVHPEDRARAHDTLQAAADSGAAVWCEEYRFLRRDKTYADIQDRGYVMRDENGGTTRMIGTMQCISERKRAEAKIFRLNRTYAMLSGVNSAIVRIRDRSRMFREACRIAVELGQFEIAWIGEFQRELNHFEVFGHHGSGLEPNTLEQLVRLASSGAANDIGRSLHTGRPIACNDVDPHSDMGRLLAPTGFNAFMVLPFVVGKAVVGAMILHTKEREFFDSAEIKLLSELADNVSFALGYLVQEAKVQELAYQEPLTRLPNRAALQSYATTMLARANPTEDRLALVLLNLNDLRDINDSLGHQNGDLLLQSVAAKLRGAVSMIGHVASLGGDEFAVLLPRIQHEAEVHRLLEQMAETLQHPMNVANIPIRVESCFGVAVYPEHGECIEALWQHADVALRTAKERRLTCVVYNTNIDHYDPQRLALLGELRAGIENDELVLHYQPKIDVVSGQVMGVEALVRWNHSTRGLIYPDTFIPLAEQTGLINPLTTAVVTAALKQAKLFEEAGLVLELSVNISARNLQEPDFCSRLLQLVSNFGYSLSRLTLEITESAIMADPTRAKAALDELRAAGIHLSMDDFGIGQSSLTYLKDLPISRMKIDKSFVMDFKEPRNRAIVRSAIDLARNLDLQVTAEGVEDADTYAALRDLGCHVAQGYYFSKPLPADKLWTWIQESGRGPR